MTSPYATWPEAKKNLMNGPPESSCWIALDSAISSPRYCIDLWRGFCSMLLGADDRLYIRFVGKPDKRMNGRGVNSYPQGSMIVVDWLYPNRKTFESLPPTLNLGRYGFSVTSFDRETNRSETMFISVNQREWLTWLPIVRRVELETKVIQRHVVFERDMRVDDGRALASMGTRKVITKRLRLAVTTPEEVEKVMREFHAMMLVRCSYIVKVLGVFMEGNDPARTHLITESTSNSETLTKHLVRRPMLLKDQLWCARTMAIALHHLHTIDVTTKASSVEPLEASREPSGDVRQRIMWCGSLEPDNVLVVLSWDGRPLSFKLRDAYLSKIEQRSLTSVCSGPARHSAPEIDSLFSSLLCVETERLKHKAKRCERSEHKAKRCERSEHKAKRCERSEQLLDSFSYGMVLWQLNARTAPWSSLSEIEVRRRICAGERPTLSSGHPLNDLIERCWGQEPDERPTFETILTEW